MIDYRFLTVWRIEAPLIRVCHAIEHSLDWPRWWPGVERVEELAPGNADGIGSVRRYVWKGRLPYRLQFDVKVIRSQPLALVEGQASGDVDGLGRWTFTSEGSATVACYEWQVRPTKLWMQLMTPLARPLFRWNHDILMRQGAEGLARLLGARLIAIEQR